MSAALVGLLGVVLGGLIAGITNLAVERALRRDRAVIAANILKDEIKAALTSLTSAKMSETWWPVASAPTLPAAWEKHGAEFRFIATSEARDSVRTVVELIAAKQADVADRADREARNLSSPGGTEVSPNAVTIKVGEDDLKNWTDKFEKPLTSAANATTLLKPSWNPRVLGSLVALVIAGVLVWQLSAPVYTSDAVERTLVDQTSADVAACHPAKDRDDVWDCDLISFATPDCSLFSSTDSDHGPVRLAQTTQASPPAQASQCSNGQAHKGHVVHQPSSPYMTAQMDAAAKNAQAAAAAVTIKPKKSKFLGFIPRFL